MESLAGYDRRVIVGILGGSAGTTYDAFQMLWEAKKHGARAALYGRKINNAEHQLTFISYLRALADDQIGPEEAVRAYHADLQRLKIRPRRPLEEDLKRTSAAMSYSDSATSTPAATTASRSNAATATVPVSPADPDFSKMTSAEKVEWNLAKWRRILGD